MLAAPDYVEKATLARMLRRGTEARWPAVIAS
jgi:hypothetical protein